MGHLPAKMVKSLKKVLAESIISLITVTHNDEDIVEERLKEIKKTLDILDLNYEILVIDNASTDNTVESIINLPSLSGKIRILTLSKEYDKEIAFTAGIDNCIGDFAITFDLYTDPTPMIPQIIINKALEGSDIVIGKMSKEVIRRDYLSRLLLVTVGRFSKENIGYRQNYLMGVSRKVINSIIRIRRKSRNFGYIGSLIGFKKQILEYQPLRKYRKKIKRQNFLQLVIAIIDTMVSNSFRPIRLLSLMGLFFSSLYIVYVAVIVILYLFFNQKSLIPKGWVTVSTVIGSLFFLLFSLLTIISEYVIRILNESRNEPFYFVSEEVNKSTILPKDDTLNIV